MITVLKWKKACINLLITYFNIELKRTKLTSHTDTKLVWIWVADIGWGIILIVSQIYIFRITMTRLNKVLRAVFVLPFSAGHPKERGNGESVSHDGSISGIYFNFELKRTKLTSHTDTKLVWIWVADIGCGIITVLLWKKSCSDLFIERFDIVFSDLCPDICPWVDIAYTNSIKRLHCMYLHLY
jgi:hypothetical protein